MATNPQQPQQTPAPQVPSFQVSPEQLVSIFGPGASPEVAAGMTALFKQFANFQLGLVGRLFESFETDLQTRLAPVEEFVQSGRQRAFWDEFKSEHPDMAEYVGLAQSLNLDLPETVKTEADARNYVRGELEKHLAAVNPNLTFTKPEPGVVQQPKPTRAAPSAPPAHTSGAPTLPPSPPSTVMTPATRPPVNPKAPVVAPDPNAQRTLSVADIFGQQ